MAISLWSGIPPALNGDEGNVRIPSWILFAQFVNLEAARAFCEDSGGSVDDAGGATGRGAIGAFCCGARGVDPWKTPVAAGGMEGVFQIAHF